MEALKAETDTKEDKSLWKRVEYITSELQDERARRLKLSDQLQQERATHQKQFETEKKSHAEKVSKEELLNKMRAEQEEEQEEKTYVVVMAVKILEKEGVSEEKVREKKKEALSVEKDPPLPRFEEEKEGQAGE